MSELEKLLSQDPGPANSANPANSGSEISDFSKISSRSCPKPNLQALAGDDWPEIANDPAKLAAFATAVETTELLRRGETPPHYTAQTKCRRCGPVPIFPGCPPKVLACPWCFAGPAE